MYIKNDKERGKLVVGHGGKTCTVHEFCLMTNMQKEVFQKGVCLPSETTVFKTIMARSKQLENE